ncbi:helix-turn-helix transcriptional regulator [Pseudanabaena sp. FACHB-2040]|uniref:helix-turn-helix transcriptional regulator n=1 Tax=Pseudanabaena sp. FACHB-2040 TaxID=2692859 RepID=UPI001685F9A5|nr:helix-turn-helix transcriptional regulator [Pseudanabaena sp. FACHB-2040]MBD2256429.1 helix-turn-helix transcriptional regulator [Pseudanabaena sp. FACHB-2040]
MSAGDNQLTLKQLRERAGLTQRQLADVLGVTVTTISSWERGVKKPSLSFAQVQKIIETLGCTLAELVEATQPGDNEVES